LQESNNLDISEHQLLQSDNSMVNMAITMDHF